MFMYQLDASSKLKLLDQQDTEALFSLIKQSEDHLKKWLPWVEYTKQVEDTQSFITSAMQQYADNNGWQAGIWYKNCLAGVIGFHYIDWSNQSTSIGYWLRHEYQGLGLMTKACRALMEYAFEELGLHRMEIKAAEGNEKSRAIPERLGFQKEGCLRGAELVGGRHLDIIVYGMLSEEWMKKEKGEGTHGLGC